MLSETFIFDIDNTLADNTHRVHYILDKNNKDYNKFYAELVDDKPIKDVIKLYNILQKQGYTIILVTGRPEKCRNTTMEWLNSYNINVTDLYMRQDNDYRSDAIVKKEIYEQKLSNVYNVIGVFEDRNRCVKMWRNLGLTCYQPRETE